MRWLWLLVALIDVAALVLQLQNPVYLGAGRWSGSTEVRQAASALVIAAIGLQALFMVTMSLAAARAVPERRARRLSQWRAAFLIGSGVCSVGFLGLTFVFHLHPLPPR